MAGLLQKLNKRPRRTTRENAGSRVVLPERVASRDDLPTTTPSGSGEFAISAAPSATAATPNTSITQELERTGPNALPWWVHTPPITSRWVDAVVPVTLELTEPHLADFDKDEEAFRKAIRKSVLTAAGAFSTEHALSLRETEDATTAVVNILRGRGPLEPLFVDPLVTDIFVSAHNSVQCLRRGQILETPFRFRSASEYATFLHNLLTRSELTLSIEHPVVTGMLTDCQRAKVSVIHPSLLASSEPSLALRIPRLPQVTLYELIRTKALPATLAAWLTEVMATPRCSILITGGGGTGKTTLATALLAAAPSTDRLVTIEDAPELFPTSHHLEKLLLRPALRSPAGARQLVEVALQRSPSWIAFGISGLGYSQALLRVLEGETSCMVTLQAASEQGALQMLHDDLRQLLPSATSEELSLRLFRGIDLVIVMSTHEGRPFIQAVRERSAGRPGAFEDIVRFAGEINGKRTWHLANPSSSWINALRERGHELRLGAGLLQAP